MLKTSSVFFLAAISPLLAQRTTIDIGAISLDPAARLALNEKRVGAVNPAYPGISLMAALAKADTTVTVNDVALPAPPFQLSFRNGNIEIVSVTAVNRVVAPVATQPGTQQPNTKILTVTRAQFGTAAIAVPVNTAASVPLFANVQGWIRSEILKIIGDYSASALLDRQKEIRAQFEAARQAEITAAKEAAAQ